MICKGPPITSTPSGTLNIPPAVNTGKGTVTVNATAGTFSYQPTATAMRAASADNATTTDKHDTFSIGVDDGHGGVTSVPVTVSITPQNTAPTVNYGSPVKALGIAAYTPTYSDADGDVPTITTQPTNGTVAVNVSVWA
jgi:hypothetical protein